MGWQYGERREHDDLAITVLAANPTPVGHDVADDLVGLDGDQCHVRSVLAAGADAIDQVGLGLRLERLGHDLPDRGEVG